jgi:hypothetical protein
MAERPHAVAMPGNTVLKTITDIGRFHPRVFYPEHRARTATAKITDQVMFNYEGIRILQAKNAKTRRSILNIEHDIEQLQAAIDRHREYMEHTKSCHEGQVKLMNQQIANRKAQIAKIDNAQEPPTMNQIFGLVRQIQVEGMAAKRRAENCLREQDVNLVLSSERLRRFHDYLAPRPTDNLLRHDPKLRKAYERMEKAVYRTAEIHTLLRSLKIYSTNLERKLIELNSTFEALHFDKADVQMGIVDKREELHAELTKRCEEMGKLRWKIEYLKSLKEEMNKPRFDVRG